MKVVSQTARLAALLSCFTLQAPYASGADKKPPADKNGGGDSSLVSGGIRGALADSPDAWLVSPGEAVAFQGQEGFNAQPMLRPRAVVPQIDILKPEPTADLKVAAPFAIQVQFRGQADAAIVPESFKVLYGALKLDITSRITKYVKVTAEGFTMDDARIPPGKHRLVLQIQDSKQRTVERELRVEVVTKPD